MGTLLKKSTSSLLTLLLFTFCFFCFSTDFWQWARPPALQLQHSFTLLLVSFTLRTKINSKLSSIVLQRWGVTKYKYTVTVLRVALSSVTCFVEHLIFPHLFTFTSCTCTQILVHTLGNNCDFVFTSA